MSDLRLQGSLHTGLCLKMLVEIGAVCEARKELQKETSGLSICYRKAEEYAKKRGAVK